MKGAIPVPRVMMMLFSLSYLGVISPDRILPFLTCPSPLNRSWLQSPRYNLASVICYSTNLMRRQINFPSTLAMEYFLPTISLIFSTKYWKSSSSSKSLINSMMFLLYFLMKLKYSSQLVLNYLIFYWRSGLWVEWMRVGRDLLTKKQQFRTKLRLRREVKSQRSEICQFWKVMSSLPVLEKYFSMKLTSYYLLWGQSYTISPYFIVLFGVRSYNFVQQVLLPLCEDNSCTSSILNSNSSSLFLKLNPSMFTSFLPTIPFSLIKLLTWSLHLCKQTSLQPCGSISSPNPISTNSCPPSIFSLCLNFLPVIAKCYPQDRSPKEQMVNSSPWGSTYPFFMSSFQKGRMLKGGLPCPVVETKNTQMPLWRTMLLLIYWTEEIWQEEEWQ